MTEQEGPEQPTQPEPTTKSACRPGWSSRSSSIAVFAGVIAAKYLSPSSAGETARQGFRVGDIGPQRRDRRLRGALEDGQAHLRAVPLAELTVVPRDLGGRRQGNPRIPGQGRLRERHHRRCLGAAAGVEVLVPVHPDIVLRRRPTARSRTPTPGRCLRARCGLGSTSWSPSERRVAGTGADRRAPWGPVAFGIAFLGGLVAGLGPCVLPMIPAVFGYVTGQVGESEGRSPLASGAGALGRVRTGNEPRLRSDRCDSRSDRPCTDRRRVGLLRRGSHLRGDRSA